MTLGPRRGPTRSWRRPLGRLAVIVLAVGASVSPASHLGVKASDTADPFAVDRPIQPGAPFVFWIADAHRDYTPTMKMATLGFVFASADGRLFIQASGRVLGPGSPLFVPGLGEVGSVVLHHDAETTGRCPADEPLCHEKFALVEIDKEHYSHVSPRVRHWGGPTGVARSSQVRPGDLVAFYGQGQGVREAAKARQGVVVDARTSVVAAAIPYAIEDAGAPMVDARSKLALASAELFQSERLPVFGPTVELVLQIAAERGLRLRLVTAPPRSDIPL